MYPFQYVGDKKQVAVVNWILYFPRLLYSLKEKDVISKHQGALWFSKNFSNKLGRFVMEVATCRKNNTSLETIKDLVDNSVKVMLFSLEQVIKIMGIDPPSLSSLVEIEGSKKNFRKVFRKFKELLQFL